MYNGLIKHRVSFFKYLLVFTLVVLFAQCEKSEQKKTTIKKKQEPKKAFVSQPEREIQKAKSLKMKSNKAYSHFYTNNNTISEKRNFVEEIIFDRDGNKILHNTFFSSGQIDLQWKYEYDEAGNLLHSECMAGGISKRSEEIYTYDDNGNITEIKNYLLKTKNYSKIVPKYDDEGLKTESTLYDPQENVISKIIYAYENGKLISETYFDNKSEQTGQFNFQYDSLGNIIEETKIAPGLRTKTTKYLHDSNNNVVSIDESYFRQDFEYDSQGNIVVEQRLDGKGNRQLRTEHKFNENGLMIETVKISGSGKPEIFIEYEYEFYE